MNRVTADRVKAAYDKTGLVPTQGVYFLVRDGKECACGLSAVAIAETNVAKWQVFDMVLSVSLGLEYGYVAGFLHGFDRKVQQPGWFDRRGYREGHADGWGAAQAVFA